MSLLSFGCVDCDCLDNSDILAPRLPNQRAQEAADRVSLKIEMDDIRGLWIPDATQVPIHGLVDVFAVLRLGAQRRY
jgi:hypothetical protein